MNQKYQSIAVSLISMALATGSTTAAEIIWNASTNITGDSDVSTNGESRLALNTGNAVNVVVNGVSFTGITNAPVLSTTALPFSSTIDANAPNAFQRGALPNDPLVDELGDMLVSGFFGRDSLETTTFTNLVVGQDYEIQIFINDARSNRNRGNTTNLSNGLDDTDPDFDILSTIVELNNSPVDEANDPPGPEEGDFIIGTFTADSTSQSFSQTGTLDGNDSPGRIQINAIRLRAVGTILPIPSEDPNPWTGLAGGDLDLALLNFSLNDPADPLTQGSLTDVNNSNGIAVFGDEYMANGAGIPVATSTLIIPANAQPTATTFSFTNSSSVPYSIESSDNLGIVGSVACLEAEGDGTLSILGTHTYGGITSIGADYTLLLGDATTATNLSTVALAITGNATYDTSTGDLSFPGLVTGAGNFTKTGDNSLILEADNAGFNGTTNVNQGTLVLNDFFNASTINIASGATLELTGAIAGRRASVTYTGDGTFLKTGSFFLDYAAGTFQLTGDALIDVQSGEFRGGSSANETWTDNLSNLNIANGAIFSGSEANVRFNVLTGQGLFSSGFATAGYIEATIGVADGSGSFEGTISDRNAAALHIANIRKVGTGTQTFDGPTDYTGNTIIEDGELIYAESSSIFFVPAANGVVNSVSGDPNTGTGSITLDCPLIFDLTSADLDLTLGNSWTILDPSNLASVTLGPDFVVGIPNQTAAFTEVTPGVWTFTTVAGTDLTFQASTFTLFVGTPADLPGGGVALVSIDLNANGEIEASFSGLNPSANYQLMRSPDLVTPFSTAVGPVLTGSQTNTFTDPAPLPERAFYQLFILP